MRIIKFRGLRTDGKGWVYGMLFHNNKIVTETVSYESPLVEKESPCYKYEYINIIPETVCQFTGLHDRNGKEIYEGDILEDSLGRRKVVEYYQDGFWLNGSLEGAEWSLRHTHKSSKIIGNIHENKELLDKNLSD